MKRIIISVTNDLVSDQRVHKISTSLVKMGFELTLFGRKLSNSLPVNDRNYKIKRIKLLFNKGSLFYAEYNFRLFFYLLFSKFTIAVANDLDTLPANFLASKIRLKKLVYDSHEYFTEVPELIGRSNTRKIWLTIEKFILPRVKTSYTVCDSIAKIYHAKYGVDMKVVRNMSLYQREILNSFMNEENKQVQNDGVPQDNISIKKKTIIYQGALNVGRGIETIIKAMQYIENTVFLIIGDGDIREQLKELVMKLNVSEKVLFTGKIPLQDLPTYTRLAHVGISLEENLGKNYYYSLPNKLFDYINAEIPVFVSDLPEMRNIVDTYKIGIIAENNNPEYIAKTLISMMNDETQRAEWKTNLENAAKILCWENEEKMVFDIYGKFLKKSLRTEVKAEG